MVDSIVDRCVVGNAGRCSSAVCMVMMSVDRCFDSSVVRRRIPYPIGMEEKTPQHEYLDILYLIPPHNPHHTPLYADHLCL